MQRLDSKGVITTKPPSLGVKVGGIGLEPTASSV